MRAIVGALVSGVLFAVGLALGGMTQPSKVLGFLDVLGAWDPSLVFVMGGAVGVHFFLFRWISKRPRPLFGARFHLPTRTDIDASLVAGAALFGMGWGLAGYCPGPAIASLATGGTAMLFVVAMFGGMALYAVLDRMKPRAHTNSAGEAQGVSASETGGLR
jgi:uncharacterized protein